MFDLQKQNEKVLESALADKRKKIKQLDQALREVDMELNQAQVRAYYSLWNISKNELWMFRSKRLFSITTQTKLQKSRANWIWMRSAKWLRLFA